MDSIADQALALVFAIAVAAALLAGLVAYRKLRPETADSTARLRGRSLTWRLLVMAVLFGIGLVLEVLQREWLTVTILGVGIVGMLVFAVRAWRDPDRP